MNEPNHTTAHPDGETNIPPETAPGTAYREQKTPRPDTTAPGDGTPTEQDDDPTLALNREQLIPHAAGPEVEEPQELSPEPEPEEKQRDAAAHYLDRIRERSTPPAETAHYKAPHDTADTHVTTPPEDKGDELAREEPGGYRTTYARSLDEYPDYLEEYSRPRRVSVREEPEEPYRDQDPSGLITRRDYFPDEWEEYAPRGNRSIRSYVSPKALIALGVVACVITVWAIFQMGAAPRASEASEPTAPHGGVEQSQPAPQRSASASTEPSHTAQGSAAPNPEPSKGTIRVHVAGAVKAPGVHTLPSDARAVDALTAAGGATGEADLNRVNLAGSLSDGVQLYIPKEGEEIPQAPANGGAGGSGTAGAGQGASKPAAGGASASASAGAKGSASAASGGQVNLNTATAEQLQTLPRIGPALAARIIAWRDEHGGFKSVDELDAVPGIGPAMMTSLRPLVTV